MRKAAIEPRLSREKQEELTFRLRSLKSAVRKALRSGQWDVALRSQQELVDCAVRLADEPRPTAHVASLLIGSMFFYPYFRDDPAEFRSLQNRMGAALYRAMRANGSSEDCEPAPSARCDTGKLTIGFVSNGLRHHSVGLLARDVLRSLDRDSFRICLYMVSGDDVLDRVQLSLIAAADSTFRSMDPWMLARRIRMDRVDILVDLDSASVDVTAMVVALKPAAKVVTWLGWDASGVPAVDGFLADSAACPDATARHYREKVLTISDCHLAVAGFEIGQPSITREALGIPGNAFVFYSSQSPYKRNPRNIRDQLAIVAAVPGSFVVYKGGDVACLARTIGESAQEIGLSPERVRILEECPDQAVHRANLSIADLVLDTYPYNGVTTTLEALWSGLPVLTQAGAQYAARCGASILGSSDLGDLVAGDPEAYRSIGTRLGCDREAHRQVLARCRQARMRAPVFDPGALAMKLGRLLRSLAEPAQHRA